MDKANNIGNSNNSSNASVNINAINVSSRVISNTSINIDICNTDNSDNVNKTLVSSESARAVAILDRLRTVHPVVRCELDHSNIYELLIATVMSANTTDKQVNKVTPALFARANNPYDMLSLTQGEICNIIKSCGNFNNKARYIFAISDMIVRLHGGVVPHDKESLVAMPGVGEKSASVLLSIGYNIPAIAVDTHVGRVSMRLGLIETDKNPTKASQILQSIVPIERWIDYHMLIVIHGRYHCKARAPQCGTCPIQGLCKSYIASN